MTKDKESSETSEGMLVEAAKAIGTAAGKVAAAVGITTPARAKTAKPKPARLVKKNKARLPRKQKKAAKKAKKALS
jgi:hypothetical protein